jgi:hypothetical protein
MLAAFTAVLRQAPVLTDPTFKELSKLVGGEWVGRGPKVEIHHKFEFAVDGKMIKGHGQVRVGGRVVLEMQPNMGWDPVAKQVTYVDFHDFDTVYTGHVSLKDG